MAYLLGYCYRLPITIDHTQVASDLTDFPLRVVLSGSSTRSIAAEVSLAEIMSLGTTRTIRMTESDGTTVQPFEPTSLDYVLTSPVSCTADSGTDAFTSNAHGLNNDELIFLHSTTSVPGGTTNDTSYYVTGKTTNTFQVALLKGGPAIDLTTNGSGTITWKVYETSWDWWVKVATVSHVADTTIYLNFDHRAADASSGYNPTSVWNSSHQAVIHGEQTPTGSAGDILDSTANGNDGTSHGSLGALVTGKIGHALDFDGSNDYISFGITHFHSAVTVSAWIYPRSNSSYPMIATDGLSELRLHAGTGKLSFLYNGEGSSPVDSNALSLNAWHHVVGRYDGSTIKIFVDGVETGSFSYSTTADYPSGNALYCGARSDGSFPFDGLIDELRVQSVSLSADEIAYLYTNVSNNSATISFGSVQTSDQVNFDAASDSGYVTSASSTTFGVTCLGEYRYIEYTIGVLAAGVSVTSVVRNSQTATAIDSKATVTTLGTQYTFRQIAPTAGTYNVTVTLSGSAAAFGAAAVSFTGVDQTTPTEDNASAQATNVGAADASVAVVTDTDADWICFGVISDDGSITAISGDTQRANITGGVGTAFAGTYGPKASHGSQTVGCTNVGALATWAICGNAIRPKSAESVVSDTVSSQICM